MVGGGERGEEGTNIRNVRHAVLPIALKILLTKFSSRTWKYLSSSSTLPMSETALRAFRSFSTAASVINRDITALDKRATIRSPYLSWRQYCDADFRLDELSKKERGCLPVQHSLFVAKGALNGNMVRSISKFLSAGYRRVFLVMESLYLLRGEC